MPRIIVRAESSDDREGPILLHERVSLQDFESDHFSAALVERVGWAVTDADDLEAPSGRVPKGSLARRRQTR